MLHEIIQTYDKITILNKDKTIDASALKEDFAKLVESSYYSPSLIVASNELLSSIINDNYWLVLHFNHTQKFKALSFDKLLIPIKPKCNWLTLYRINNNNIETKCVNLNLSTKTTMFYKKLEALIKSTNN